MDHCASDADSTAYHVHRTSHTIPAHEKRCVRQILLYPVELLRVVVVSFDAVPTHVGPNVELYAAEDFLGVGMDRLSDWAGVPVHRVAYGVDIFIPWVV